VLVLVVAAPFAGAHVEVSSPDAAPGAESAKLVFRVPNESDKASTMIFAVKLPADTPFAEVSAQAKPGWDVATTTKKLSPPADVDGFKLSEMVSTVTWTATGDTGIAPGEFDEFALSVGPVPDDASSLSFPATQWYSDGTTVEWNQPQPPGADEPEHPAPTLELTAATDATGATASPAASDSGSSSTADTAATTSDSSSDTLARVLGGLGILLGLAAVVLVLVRRRTS